MTPVAQALAFTPSELWSVIGVLVFILGAVVLSRKVFGHEPPLHKEYATREQLADQKREIEKLDNERRVSVAKIHDKIETQGNAIAGLKTESAAQTRQLHALDDKIENLPEKILRLLERREKS